MAALPEARCMSSSARLEFALYPYNEKDDGSLTSTDKKPALAENTQRETAAESGEMTSYTYTFSGIEPGIYWLRETKAPDESWDKVEDVLVEILADGTPDMERLAIRRDRMDM